MFGMRAMKQQGVDSWKQMGDRIVRLRDEVLRRNALAREPQPDGVTSPSIRLLLREFGTGAERFRDSARIRREGGLAMAPAQSRAVMLLPGFGAHPARMRPLRRALESAGHRVSDWGLGFNLGPTAERFELLLQRIETMARREGQPLVLVGWSLGGIYAREAAKRLPHAVSLVITMGTPFSGDRRANNAWRAYHFVTGHRVEEPPVGDDIAAKPPVPTVALWSPRDGIVAPRAAAGWPGERDEAIAIRCTHLGFASHPAVAREVGRLLGIY
ncbi:esterase/lipase family protein [Novosphingobium lentum]|uniref:esterase/lipase family protein n=1 Tax=Novosphingobium lentum TaxID=145287 RepID=UPI000A5E9ECB|nr:alpha/beta hydrolase [Novosphingobium lentum]